MTSNSKKRLEMDRAAIRKFQAETDRRAAELRGKILADQAKVKSFLKNS